MSISEGREGKAGALIYSFSLSLSPHLALYIVLGEHAFGKLRRRHEEQYKGGNEHMCPGDSHYIIRCGLTDYSKLYCWKWRGKAGGGHITECSEWQAVCLDLN